MSEYIISNEFVTLAVDLEDGSWRVLGIGAKAFWFEWDTGKLDASFYEKVLVLEDQNVLTDDGTAILYQLETPSVRSDEAQVALLRRVDIEVDTRGQLLTPTVRIDDEPLVTLPVVQTTARANVELPVGRSGRVFSVRLDGQLTDRVDLFGIALDIEAGPSDHD